MNRPRRKRPAKPSDGRTRIQRFLSDAGVVSRRAAEELVREGRVLVNGRTVDELPAFVDPATDVVEVDGRVVRPRRTETFILNKPKGVVCTPTDRAGRRTARDFLPPGVGPLTPVGRLDAESTGLVILTSDGELAQQLSHPSYQVNQVYHAEVSGLAAPDLPEKMRAGVYFAEGRAQADAVEILHRARDRSSLRITLHETRNRQVRRMLAKLGLPVRVLDRLQVGPITLKGLARGAVRRLTAREVTALRQAIQYAPGRPRRSGAEPGPRARRTAGEARPVRRVW